MEIFFFIVFLSFALFTSALRRQRMESLSQKKRRNTTTTVHNITDTHICNTTNTHTYLPCKYAKTRICPVIVVYTQTIRRYKEHVGIVETFLCFFHVSAHTHTHSTHMREQKNKRESENGGEGERKILQKKKQQQNDKRKPAIRR